MSSELVLSFVVSPCASELEAQVSETMLLISALGLGFIIKICFFYLWKLAVAIFIYEPEYLL